MTRKKSSSGLSLSEDERSQANKDIVTQLQTTLNDARQELKSLRTKLSATYVVIVVLSIIMFALGMVLLSVPIVAAFQGRITELQSLIAAGFGIADLTALFLSRPLERLHGLMGDMGQLTLALNSFQTQVGLRLLEMNSNDRETIGKAAEEVNKAAKDSIKSIQEYFEVKEGTKTK